MSLGRATATSANAALLADLNSALSAYQKTQEQISSGKRITQPSDDPAGTVTAMQLKAEQSRVAQYGKSATDGAGWLSQADSTLSSAISSLTRVQTLVVNGSSSSSDSASDDALADELDSVTQSLLQDANTTYNGRPIFGGTTSGSVAYDSDGTYVGDAGSVNRTVSDGVSVQVSTSGPDTFGDVFSTLTQLSTALRTGDGSTLSAGLAKLDSAITKLQVSQAAVGARENQVTAAQSALTDRTTTLAGSLSDVQDTDYASAILSLSSQQVAYQAALSSAAKIMNQSLADFLS